MVEALTGLGLIVGPVIGSALYSLLGYAHTFFVFGSFLVFLSFVIKLNFPEDEEIVTNNDDDRFMGSNVYDDLSSFRNEVTPTKQNNKKLNDEIDSSMNKVSMCSLLCSGRYTFAALSSALCYFNYSFMEPILAERLVDFDLSSMQIGLFFAIFATFYIPASVLVCLIPN